MEHSMASLTFEASIPKAITEAKTQRKLFVVYISGGNAESNQLEQSTWTNKNVAEAVKKHCILLHLSEGSIDATQFSAIYPQNHIPCITAIGYNGVQLWKLEGYVEADVLVSNLEKGWLDVHIQQTTASFICAALASGKSEPSLSGTSNATSNQESISIKFVPPQSEANDDIESERNNENNDCRWTLEEKLKTGGGSTESSFSDIRKSETIGNENPTPATASKVAEEVSSPNSLNLENIAGANTWTAGCSIKEINSNQSVAPTKGQKYTEENTCLQTEQERAADDDKIDNISNHEGVHKSSDVHLNIRLPNATCLQEIFSLTSTFRMVKEYVDENLASGISHYDIAIPFPRKTFTDEDLNKSLLELGLSDRQALIVVPHRHADHNKRSSPSPNADSSSSADDSVVGSGGYFAYFKGILSYINPLSYLAGANASTSGQEAQNGMWEYGPDPALGNNLVGTERPYSSYQPNRNSNPTNGNDGRSRWQPSRFGSNIHTLRHDEDDKPFGDSNAFWNGNSTQFGGNNDGK